MTEICGHETLNGPCRLVRGHSERHSIVAYKCVDCGRTFQGRNRRCPSCSLVGSGEYAERAVEMDLLRQDGLTLKAIGQRFGLTTERVRQIEARHRARERQAVWAARSLWRRVG